MAGCATPTSSAGHTNGSVSDAHEPTLQPDHSMGASNCRSVAMISSGVCLFLGIKQFSRW